MANTTNNPIDKAVDTAAAAPKTAANGGIAPPRDAAPGSFNSIAMLKDKVLGVVRKLTGGTKPA